MGVRDLDLVELLLVAGHRDLQTPTGDDLPFVHRVLVGVPEADELVILLDRGERESRREPDRLLGERECGLELRAKRLDLLPGRAAVEPPDPDIDRVDLPPSEDRS